MRRITAFAVKRPAPVSLAKLCFLLVLTWIPTFIQAQSNQTWLDTNANNEWSLTAPNWEGAMPWSQGNNAIFGGVGETVELAGGLSVGNITFNSTGYTIADANSDSLLTLGGPSTITVTTSGHIATISESLTSGALTKAGAGTLVLSGDNSFSGAVTVSAGLLALTSGTALGDTSGETFIAQDARLELRNGVTVSGETVNITGGGLDFFGALRAGVNATATWDGPIKLDSGSRIGALSGGTLTISGPISTGSPGSALNISATGSGASLGTVVLSSAANTYTGATNILRGRLQLGISNGLPTTTTLDIDSTSAVEDSIFDLAGFSQTLGALQRSGAASGTGGSFITNSGVAASTLTVNQSVATVFSGIIQDGTGVVNLTKGGTGSLTLSGANTYTGATVLTAGVGNELVVGHATALGDTAGGTVVNATARLVLANTVVVTGESVSLFGTGGNNNGALQTAVNATAEWAGNILVNGTDARIGGGNGGTLIVSGVISGAAPTSGVLFSRGLGATTVLKAVNTYTGDTQIFASGALPSTLRIDVDNAINAASKLSVISTAASQNMVIDLNGHILTLSGLDTSAQHLSGAFLSVSNSAAASPATLTVSGTVNAVYAGSLRNGAGSLSFIKSGSNTQTLIAANNYTGSTTVNAGTLKIGGAVSTLGVNGSLASTDIIVNGGTFQLDNTGASNNSGARLANTATVTLRGGAFLFSGSEVAGMNSSETLGAFALGARVSTITTTFGGVNTATVTAGQLSRAANGGIALVNGIDLGKDGTSTASISRVLFTTAPTLVGGTAALSTGINAAAKNTEIVPFLLGAANAVSGGSGTSSAAANTFVTYNATTGLRPLNPIDEFSQDVFTAGHNTRINANATVSADIAINSLILSGASVAINSGRTLTVDSGAILITGGANLGISGGTLAFGGREGIITINASPNTTLGSLITGTAGVSYYGSGTLVLANLQHAYTGDTGLYVGTVIPQASSLGSPGSPTSGSFGRGALIFGGSAIRSTTTTAITIGNAVTFQADTTVPSSGVPANDKSLIFTGPVTLTGGQRTLVQNSGADTLINGVVGDGGQNLGLTISGTGAGSVILSGANTYTGPTVVTGSSLLINGNQSAATGTVTVGTGGAGTGVLGGIGIIGGSTVIRGGGTLSPGTPGVNGGLGELSIAGSLTLQAGSITNLQITNATFTSPDSFGGYSPGTSGYADYVIANGSSVGNGHDHLAIGATVTQETGAKINVLPITFTPVEGQIFNLLDWTAIAGNAFSTNLGSNFRDGSDDSGTDLDLPNISGSGLTWDISLFTSHGIIVVTPEPARALLLGLGLAGGLLRRRRRRV